MTKIYKATLYFVDSNDKFGRLKDFEIGLNNYIGSIDGFGLISELSESREFEWHDDLKINEVDAPVEAYEAYFPSDFSEKTYDEGTLSYYINTEG